LEAFAATKASRAVLVFAGDGPLREALHRKAVDLGITEQVRFLGFMNQSQLPAVYRAADLMVLPSEYEPFAVVVNEASCCGCPVAASDRVGAAADLIAPVNPDFIFPCGDISALTRLLKTALRDPHELERRGQNARQRMKTWSMEENVNQTVAAIEQALSRRISKESVS
jgi:glycosyltransferase involved in cell wall biosynthesis